MFTQNDYYILESILDKSDEDKGMIKTKGTTKKEIIDKTKLSLSKVTLTLGMLESHGYIEVGLKVKNAKSYIVSEKGIGALSGFNSENNIVTVKGNNTSPIRRLLIYSKALTKEEVLQNINALGGI